jgi:cytochrome c
MSSSVNRLARIAAFGLTLSTCLLLANATLAADKSGYYGYGQPATAEQIAGWDIDVRPDGKGLPPGSGSVEDGEYLYEEKCAGCHGSFGEGVGKYPSLSGGDGSLQDDRPHKTVGSYWKYTSTLWDYINRAMPFSQPESLEAQEVYAITAYVLYLNELVESDFVLSQDNLASIRLPNEGNFIPDARPDVANKHCMKKCKKPGDIKITSEAPAYVPEAEIRAVVQAMVEVSQ